MFWRTYGSVIGWMLGVGIVVGGLFLFVVFGWLVPPDRGEESVIVVLPAYGGFFGALTAASASLTYATCLALWTRRRRRSIASRAWVGGLSSAVGALGFWLIFGFVLSGPYGLAVWGAMLGGASAILAMSVAVPLTVRAARRAREQLRGGESLDEASVDEMDDSVHAREVDEVVGDQQR
ncbi:hypothetical protein OAU46_03215 [Microbacterium terricola]|uniref:Uncharacterized protein n=1 Tax=Microbacterium terricola TaxID=344163 RepID=A0ABM8E1F7_9MICO|nr:hypothetical protein [Microbacterium terricola]UYK41661.1 hypothetical protein OAU46_03215 [Microbacterium terricola]BDV31590.1 hypothetical protein Microterr_22500 [Microbacterium terricola]